MFWIEMKSLVSKAYVCGFCGNSLASEKGYFATDGNLPSKSVGSIYICHHCTKPTFFDSNGNQRPGALIGNIVKHIPDKSIETLFFEAKLCYSIGAYTSSVMCCRKLLMNISVNEGAEEGQNYTDYVNFLNDKNYIPPKGKQWVDSIRIIGNEANHKIECKSQDDATMIVNFTEMLLRFIYELPGIMKKADKSK